MFFTTIRFTTIKMYAILSIQKQPSKDGSLEWVLRPNGHAYPVGQQGRLFFSLVIPIVEIGKQCYYHRSKQNQILPCHIIHSATSPL